MQVYSYHLGMDEVLESCPLYKILQNCCHKRENIGDILFVVFLLFLLLSLGPAISETIDNVNMNLEHVLTQCVLNSFHCTKANVVTQYYFVVDLIFLGVTLQTLSAPFTFKRKQTGFLYCAVY